MQPILPVHLWPMANRLGSVEPATPSTAESAESVSLGERLPDSGAQLEFKALGLECPRCLTFCEEVSSEVKLAMGRKHTYTAPGTKTQSKQTSAGKWVEVQTDGRLSNFSQTINHKP